MQQNKLRIPGRILGFMITTMMMTVMLLSCANSASPENDAVGNMTVFSQNYTSMNMVPDNVFITSDLEPYTPVNQTLTYSNRNNCIRLEAIEGVFGKLVVSGLSPSLSTTVSFDIEMGRTNYNAELNIFAGNAWLIAKIMDNAPSDTLRIYSYYYNPKLVYRQFEVINTGTDDYCRFHLSISTDCQNKTNTIYINGKKKITCPILWYDEDYSPTSYNSFMNPFAYFYFSLITPGDLAYLQLYSISQTIPKNRYITPISDPRIVPFGIDGPHPLEYVDDGLALMTANGQRGTIWADPLYIKDYSPEDLMYLKQLIFEKGWELGIHYSERLNTLKWEDAKTLMDSEYNYITTAFGTNPKSWCSLGNADNTTHADYAYLNLGMVWRNAKNGVGIFSNVGNLMDEDWGFWANASKAGAVIPSFTHRLDTDPAIMFSVGPRNLSTFIYNYKNKNIQIVGYREYWENVQNSFHTVISNFQLEKGSYLNFTVENISGTSRLFISIPSITKILDAKGQNIPFERVDGGIITEVTKGSYNCTY